MIPVRPRRLRKSRFCILATDRLTN